MQKMKNGWGFDGVAHPTDGQPWHLNYEFLGDYSGAGEGFDRPDVIGPIAYSSNPSQFPEPGFLRRALHLGNPMPTMALRTKPIAYPEPAISAILGRNSLKGPSFKEFNFSIFKDTMLTERVSMQLRAEFFNLLNHPELRQSALAQLHRQYRSADASTGQRRRIPLLTATGDVGIGNPFLGGGGPRGVQFAAVLTF